MSIPFLPLGFSRGVSLPDGKLGVVTSFAGVQVFPNFFLKMQIRLMTPFILSFVVFI